MAEKLPKYKDILAREHKKFKEEMKKEVSDSLLFQLSKGKQDLMHV